MADGEFHLPAGNARPDPAGEPWTIRRIRDVDGSHRQFSKADVLASLRSGELDLEDEVLRPSTQRWEPLWRIRGVPRPDGWNALVATLGRDLSDRADLVRTGRLPFDEYRRWRQGRLLLMPSEGVATQLDAGDSAGDRRPGSCFIPAEIRREYEFVRELGQGGCGSVSLWRNKENGTPVAIKVTEPGLGDVVRNEVAMLEQLSSFHVVRVRHYGQIDGSAGRRYVIFDFVSGDTLAQFIARGGPPDAATVKSILTDIARGLSDIHAKRIVHGDLKPANIILKDAGESGGQTAVLIDLGIARSELRAGSRPLGGTPGYRSPEQERGDVCTAASDVYCFGLIAYELATRRRVVGAQLLRMHDVCPELPPQLDALIKERCLVDDPSCRIVDGQALCVELGRIFGAAPVPPPVPGFKLADPASARPASSASVHSVAPWRRRREASEARSGADAGDVDAMYRLAMMHLEGRGVPQDTLAAGALLRQAASGGQVDAMLELARLLKSSKNVADFHQGAVFWFRRAAASGSATAMFEVAKLHDGGFKGIVADDRREWLDWIERAAMGGHAPSMWHLGRALQGGELRAQDRAQAVAWFREGAERGDLRCMLVLAWCLHRGDGCIRDRFEARRWVGRLGWMLFRRCATTIALWSFTSACGLTAVALVALAVTWRISGWAPFGIGYPDWLWPFPRT